MIWLICYLVGGFLTFGVLCVPDDGDQLVCDVFAAVFWPVIWIAFAGMAGYWACCMLLNHLHKEENRNAHD